METFLHIRMSSDYHRFSKFCMPPDLISRDELTKVIEWLDEFVLLKQHYSLRRHLYRKICYVSKDQGITLCASENTIIIDFSRKYVGLAMLFKLRWC